MLMIENKLDSDWSHRPDLKLLVAENLEEAQKEKEELEQIQRTDEKMRKKWKKMMKKTHSHD